MKRKEIRNREDGATKASDNGKTERVDGKDRSTQWVGKKEWLRMVEGKIADDWWSRNRPEQKVRIMKLALMLHELGEKKRIEIRLEEGAVKARFVHILNRPEAGCLSTIMLPELPPGGSWN